MSCSIERTEETDGAADLLLLVDKIMISLTTIHECHQEVLHFDKYIKLLQSTMAAILRVRQRTELRPITLSEEIFIYIIYQTVAELELRLQLVRDCFEYLASLRALKGFDKMKVLGRRGKQEAKYRAAIKEFSYCVQNGWGMLESHMSLWETREWIGEIRSLEDEKKEREEIGRAAVGGSKMVTFLPNQGTGPRRERVEKEEDVR